jgi:DNA-binding response OmpR family regulator
MDDYLTKPLQAKSLFAMIERVLQPAGELSTDQSDSTT